MHSVKEFVLDYIPSRIVLARYIVHSQTTSSAPVPHITCLSVPHRAATSERFTTPTAFTTDGAKPKITNKITARWNGGTARPNDGCRRTTRPPGGRPGKRPGNIICFTRIDGRREEVTRRRPPHDTPVNNKFNTDNRSYKTSPEKELQCLLVLREKKPKN